MPDPIYSRVLLKLSGESLRGDQEFGISPVTLKFVASEVHRAWSEDVQIGIVIGGGNIWRGAAYEQQGMDRSTADYAGELGTEVRTQSAIAMPVVAEPYIRRRAIRHMEKGRIVILAGGTGNPYMSTDTAAALRGLELGANALLMAKNNVDGVYDSDPRQNPSAKKFDHITHHEALSLRLQALDSTALSLCMDNEVPIAVFNLFEAGNLTRVLGGENTGTLITASKSEVD